MQRKSVRWRGGGLKVSVSPPPPRALQMIYSEMLFYFADPGAPAVRVLVSQRQDHHLRHTEDQGLLRLG